MTERVNELINQVLDVYHQLLEKYHCFASWAVTRWSNLASGKRAGLRGCCLWWVRGWSPAQAVGQGSILLYGLPTR